MIDADIYADLALEAAEQYAADVKSRAIVTNRWIRLAAKRYYKDLKRKVFDLDYDKVLLVYRFMSFTNVNKDGEYKQFEILPYQAFIVLNLFLFYYKSNARRRFKYAFLFMAKKNGKTVFSVLLNLYFVVFDGVTDPESFLVASTKEQAGVALNYAKQIVNNSPALQGRLKAMQYQIRYRYDRSAGYMKTVAADKPASLDGPSISSAIIDEIHAQRDDGLFNVVKSGTVAHLNPMILLISTAGFEINSFCYTMFEVAKNILLGTINDDSMFALLYTLDDKDLENYDNPDLWIKANPALGTVLRLDTFLTEFNTAQNTPSQLNNFLTKHLNVFTSGADRWIPEEDLQRANTSYDIAALDGWDAYLGLDLSSTRDLSANVCLFHNPETDKYFAYPLFWFVNRPDKKLRPGGIDLSSWISQGLITQCKTRTIDYDLIFETITNLSKRFSIVALGYDPYNSDLIIPRLESLGVYCVPFPQNPKTFNFPLKYLEKLIYDDRISFGKDPVLMWNFRNVVLYQDGNNNIKIMKNRSKDSVDGAVALGMAVAMWLAVNLDSDKANLDAYLQQNTPEN